MKTPTSPTRSEGFTLLEMVVVITIVGIISTVAVMRLDAVLPSRRLAAAAESVVAAAEIARSEARLKQINVTLEYDLDNNRWMIYALDLPLPPEPAPDERAAEPEGGGPGPVAEPQAPPEPEWEILVTDAPPKGVRITRIRYGDSGSLMSGVAAVDFRPSGAVGEHMVEFEDESGSGRAVFVPALVGSAFAVQDGVGYEEIRAGRRLK